MSYRDFFIFGGKSCAALDRQHPRDLYDMKFLLDNEGFTEEIRKGFLVYLLSHDRPMHESLDPVLKDVRLIYESEFQGITNEVVLYDELVNVRAQFYATQGQLDLALVSSKTLPRCKNPFLK